VPDGHGAMEIGAGMGLSTPEHKLLDHLAYWVQNPRSWYHSGVVCGIHRPCSRENAVLDRDRDFLFGIRRKRSFKSKAAPSI